MKLFKCSHCGQLLYFENSRCEKCGYQLGFVAESLQLVPLIEQPGGLFSIYGENDGMRYYYCANHEYLVCNWLVPENNKSGYCTACALNRTIPDLSNPQYRERWNTIENAKHRLIYSLLRMKLPVRSKREDPHGLLFDFMADEGEADKQKVLTGHDDGIITLNIAEADDIEREMARKAMAEVYRTVLGHFRHEVGHYYWDRLIDGSVHLGEFRRLFGDETRDYSEALKEHYEKGAPSDWNNHYISSYATTHPWEDWAETWAHYMHIMFTLETAYAFGLSVQPIFADPTSVCFAEIKADPFEIEDFHNILNLWLPLTFALNSLNRSMGLNDLYPFLIPSEVMEKLSFIHKVCFAARKKEKTAGVQEKSSEKFEAQPM